MFIRKFRTYNPVLELKISKAYNFLKERIQESLNSIWFVEEYDGKPSRETWNDYQFTYLAIWHLVLLALYKENNPGVSWSTIYNKFDIASIKEAFACKGIDYDPLMELFQLPYSENSTQGISDEGLGYMQIGTTFQLDKEEAGFTVDRRSYNTSILKNILDMLDYDLFYIDCDNKVINFPDQAKYIVTESSRDYVVTETDNKLLEV